MTLRSRPVLDRKHRPRWQDELRTQQLIVVGFAIAIAVAIGIFGAAAWNGYWETHSRPIADVAGTSFNKADLDQRETILTMELVANLQELQGQLTGGPRDQIINQQIEQLNSQASGLTATAATSLVDGEVLASRAGDFDVSVSDDELDAEVAKRLALPERVHANLILIEALPEDAEAGSEPTDEQRQAALDEAQAAKERVEGGEDFATVAKDVSDDFTGDSGGGLGWFGAGDVAYGEYFDAMADASAGDLVGPIETDRGAAVLQLVERREATGEGPLVGLLRGNGISDEEYREFVRGDILDDAYREHFETAVVVSPADQRRVAQILIAPVSGTPVPQVRARHVLISPDPSLQDQAEATDEQWAAAEAEAEEVRGMLEAEDADWNAIADEHSDDTGSGSRGGDLGWSDPENSPYVPEFSAALAELEVGEISEPVRSDFGWHVIQKTGERESPQAEAEDIAAQLADDPDAFAALAEQYSEDPETASDGGELGWVARYQLSRIQEDAVFALGEVGEISPVVDAGEAGIVIYRLLETNDSQEIEADRLDEIRANGFERWLDEVVRNGVETWLDPQYETSPTTAA
jgi:parvulin-like peptidyl-prolyl isomerase